MKTKKTKWVMFTKRTNDPKLSWLRDQLDKKGIPNRIGGESFHAPILEVPENRLAEAWELLPLKIDNLADNHKMFRATVMRSDHPEWCQPD